jgi:Lanthionine synthetase C-like protein
MSTAEIFDAYLDDYLGSMAELSWSDIVRRQQGFYANLAYGAAGIAYAHWYAGYLRQDTWLLGEAERWIRAALAGQRHRFAFVDKRALPVDAISPGAYLVGRTGLYVVRALVAHSRDDRRTTWRALTRFAELCRTTAEGTADLYMGTAGCLAATAILFDHLRDTALLDLGAELCAALMQRAVRTASGGGETTTWEGRGPGLAHGPAGAFLAILLWSAAARYDTPRWFTPSLATLVAAALDAHQRSTGATPSCSRPCGGLSGVVFLAARAAELLGDSSLLAAARSAGALVIRHPPAGADLCCGRTSCAFALLPLARQDAGGPWRKAAQDLALSTLLRDRADWPLTGLYGGEAALACLAVNLTSGIDSGPPGIDLIEPPPGNRRRPAAQPS